MIQMVEMVRVTIGDIDLALNRCGIQHTVVRCRVSTLLMWNSTHAKTTQGVTSKTVISNVNSNV